MKIRKEHVSPQGHRYRARTNWTKIHGEIPDGHHIHHKDGDVTNDDIENLECLPAEEHLKLHYEEMRGPEYDIPKHLRTSKKAWKERTKERRREYNREYMRRYRATKRDEG